MPPVRTAPGGTDGETPDASCFPAPFRNPVYHSPADTPVRLADAAMVRVVHELAFVDRELAGAGAEAE